MDGTDHRTTPTSRDRGAVARIDVTPDAGDAPERGDGADASSPAGAPSVRRRELLASAGFAATALSAGCLGGLGGLRDGGSSSGGLAPLVADGTGGRWAAHPDDLTAEPMDTQVRTIDDTPVLYQYGSPVPGFDTWDGNHERRGYRSLDGTWRFRFDPEDRGLGDGWHVPSYDESDWREVPVPLPWDLYDTPGFGTYDGDRYGEGTAFRNGFAWYRRRFDVPESWDGRVVRVNFLGAHYMAWVFVNDRFVGQHEGGHTPFALDVGDALRPGEENVLAVRVFRRPWWREDTPTPLPIVQASDVPGRPVDYWPYGGLTRSVYLEASAPVFVSKLLVDGREGSLSVRAVVENRGAESASRRLAVDPGGGTTAEPRTARVEVSPGEVAVPEIEFDLPTAATWSPGAPNVHRLTAELSGGGGPGDGLSTRYGLRSLSTDGSRLTLNGEPVFLKGVNWHEETSDRGRSLEPEDYDDLVERLDDLGANFLRNSHYNRHPRLYEAADEAGVLVLDEAENVWLDGTQQWTQLNDYGLSRALVAATVWNQHNHPAVGLWSLHNECEHHAPDYPPWLADLHSVATTLDRQARPVTWAAKSPDDPAFDLADVVGFNEYYGYFRGRDDDLGRRLDGLHRRFPDRPLLVTENGTWSAPELRGGPENSPSSAGTPEWQAAKFRAHWEQATAEERLPFVAGYTYWNLRDYKERNGYNEENHNAISTMGLLPFGSGEETVAYDAFRGASNPLDG